MPHGSKVNAWCWFIQDSVVHRTVPLAPCGNPLDHFPNEPLFRFHLIGQDSVVITGTIMNIMIIYTWIIKPNNPSSCIVIYQISFCFTLHQSVCKQDNYNCIIVCKSNWTCHVQFMHGWMENGLYRAVQDCILHAQTHEPGCHTLIQWQG